MKIVIGCDHGALELKKEVLKVLAEFKDIETEDVGTFDAESVDYPDIAEKVCGKITKGEADRGIVLCGTGIGISIAANKIKGIRAALCGDGLEPLVDSVALAVGKRLAFCSHLGEAVALGDLGLDLGKAALLVELDRAKPLGDLVDGLLALGLDEGNALADLLHLLVGPPVEGRGLHADDEPLPPGIDPLDARTGGAGGDKKLHLETLGNTAADIVHVHAGRECLHVFQSSATRLLGEETCAVACPIPTRR